MRSAKAILDARSLESDFGELLGLELAISIASVPIAPTELSPGEIECCRRIEMRSRLDAWLRGRAALKALLARLGRSTDTSTIAFPSRHYSLSHSGPYAVAVAAPNAGLLGIGVDIQLGRPPTSESARLFLTTPELRWVIASSAIAWSDQLLRLWTVKEALFKADPENATTWLADYCLTNPGSNQGTARRSAGRSTRSFRYVSRRVEDGALSLAITRSRSRTYGP